MRVAARRRPRFSVRAHNAALRAGVDRALALDETLIDDLARILEEAADVAARNFERHATDHAALTAGALRQTFTAAGDVTSASTMVAVKPRPEEAARLAHAGADVVDPADLHVTLAFLGETDGDLEPVARLLRVAARDHGPLEGTVAGTARFADGGNGAPVLYVPSVPGLVELRQAAVEALARDGVDYSRQYGWVPHMTVLYDPTGAVHASPDGVGTPLHFDHLILARGDEEIARIPLSGGRPVTAGAQPADFASWRDHAWDGDPGLRELVPSWEDVDALVIEHLTAAAVALPGFCLAQELRGKTDPVRIEAVKNAMTPALEKAGLSFDPVNPFAEKALSRAASQVTGISRTTQLDVMKVVRRAHEEGLTIPQTSKAIRKAIKGSSRARARMIARTELAQAANGGSLAATRIVQESLGEDAPAGAGVALYKQWLTAPGAPHPRHEDYEGLDGQTRTLDEPFDVGGEALMYPGDPDGVPEETINCRCTLVYTEDASELTAAADDDRLASRLARAFRFPADEMSVDVELSVIAGYFAAAGSGPAGWTPPAPDEILQVHCEEPGSVTSTPIVPTPAPAAPTLAAPAAPLVETAPELRAGESLETITAPQTFTPNPDPRFVENQTTRFENAIFANARADGMTLEEGTAAVQKIVDDVVKGSEIRTRTPLDVAEKIIADGRFKSQFESGQSRGLLSPKVRGSAEEIMFGYPETLPVAERPIYGYLSVSEGGANEMYGEVAWTFKDEVRARTTFTSTDSLAMNALPSPVEAPSVLSTDLKYSNPFGPRAVPPADWGSYWETQIHGGLSLEDVARVDFWEAPSADFAQSARIRDLESKIDAKVMASMIARRSGRHAAWGEARAALEPLLADLRRELETYLPEPKVEAVRSKLETMGIDVHASPVRPATADLLAS